MLFSSVTFLFFFLPITLMLHQLLPWRWKNHVLLAASVLFYASGEPVYILLLAFSAFVGWLHGLYMTRHPGHRGALVSAICWNLVFLLFFKYADFLTGSINSLLGTSIPALGLSLPIGISFYTFQNMSYVVDVYRGESKAEKNFASYATYLCLFPQLIAGPIVRYSDVARELRERSVDTAQFSRGVIRFLVGLGKKVLLANSIGVLAELTVPDGSVLFSWLRAIAYTFQIYFDFAGYSDMAIGMGAMMGFQFPENFNYPYLSRSVTEFWRRWHMTLGGWFRDYVYIPLGGSRRGRVRTYVNKFLVFLLSGLWHGASWTFVLWGAWHGLFAVFESALGVGRKGGKPVSRPLRGLGHVYTLAVAALGFVLFRAGSLGEAWQVLRSCFTGFALTGEAALLLELVTPAQWLALAVGAAASLPIVPAAAERLGTRGRAAAESVCFLLAAALFCLCLPAVAAGGFESFIYAQF